MDTGYRPTGARFWSQLVAQRTAHSCIPVDLDQTCSSGEWFRKFLRPSIPKNPVILAVQSLLKREWRDPDRVSTAWPQDPVKRLDLANDIVSLVLKRALLEVTPQERRCDCYDRVFMVRKVKGDFRLIIDLQFLNRFVPTLQFQMSVLHQVIQLVYRGNFLTKIDLQDAYLHVPVAPASQTFLRFAMGSQHWQFRVLPFGRKSSPRIFTKVLAPVVGLLHSRGDVRSEWAHPLHLFGMRRGRKKQSNEDYR
ncbi:hypothetical protein NDU88_008142 [Pleurodeles waltl]|uniref:ribonuclease H n=1 Tax=Pleurodeles waltl TaxID=8319 RepID=A0AAV7QRZ4_PLEWA|nr:hypothetical protein NDU88_008142 [Pleurodeles waltl]